MHTTATEIHGERIYNHLLNHGGTTKAALCRVLNLTPAQVEGGLRKIREIIATANGDPFVYDPHSYQYDLARVERQAVRYLRYRLSIINRYITNLQSGTMAPAAVKFASPTLALLNHQMSEVRRTIEFAESMLP